MLVRNHSCWYKFLRKQFDLNNGFNEGLKKFKRQFPHFVVKEVFNTTRLESYYSSATLLTYVNIYSRGQVFTTWVINGYSEATYVAMSGFQ